MSTLDGILSDKSKAYLAEVADRVAGMEASAIADRVTSLVRDHDEWRGRKCLNMMAAENVISLNARRLLDSDMATRVTEGFPGDKEFPPSRQNQHVDEIEAIIIALTRQLFRAQFVEWRAVNTTMVNSVAFFALTNPGDTILVQSMEGGANMNYHPIAIPRIRDLVVCDMPPAADFDIDVDAVRKIAHEVRPRMLVIGGSYALFPYPVRELRAIADEVGATLFYDAAHVALLIAAETFQDPLAEGAHLVAMSTHKIMSGPVGGTIVTNDADIAQKLWSMTFPAFIQTRDQNKYAATAYALAEMVAFGREYAVQTVLNAQSLARALEGEGFVVLGKDRGYTMTHQVFLDLRDVGAAEFETACQNANILVHQARLKGDTDEARTGARLTVQELTRQGMKERDMVEIARFICRVALDREAPPRVAGDIEEYLAAFPRLHYSFD